MSAAEELVPQEAPLGEVERVRAEDPEFPVVLAKCRARAKGQPYDPARHGPFAPPGPRKRKPEEKPAAGNIDEALGALLKRFEGRGKNELALFRERRRKDIDE